jgi:hypothetical protein
MGGYGSGWKWARKLAVEDGVTLSLPELMRRQALKVGAYTSGGWSWRYPGHEPFASIGYMAELSPDGSGWMRLQYKASEVPMDERVRLVTTRPTYGGLRWWFTCPLCAERGKEHRVSKLYLPPGARRFGCRQIYQLTYQSCRDSGQHRALFAQLAAEMGTNTATVRASLKGKHFE